MNTPRALHRNDLFLRQLGENAPVALRATRGTVVSCLSGELWVTQEGDPHDYIVRRGYRYCCSADGVIVVNSLNGPGTALVYWIHPDACPQFNRNSVHVDAASYQRLMQRAQRLRAAAMNRLAGRFAQSLRGHLQRLLNRCSKLMPIPRHSRNLRLPR